MPKLSVAEKLAAKRQVAQAQAEKRREDQVAAGINLDAEDILGEAGPVKTTAEKKADIAAKMQAKKDKKEKERADLAAKEAAAKLAVELMSAETAKATKKKAHEDELKAAMVQDVSDEKKETTVVVPDGNDAKTNEEMQTPADEDITSGEVRTSESKRPVETNMAGENEKKEKELILDSSNTVHADPATTVAVPDITAPLQSLEKASLDSTALENSAEVTSLSVENLVSDGAVAPVELKPETDRDAPVELEPEAGREPTVKCVAPMEGDEMESNQADSSSFLGDMLQLGAGEVIEVVTAGEVIEVVTAGEVIEVVTAGEVIEVVTEQIQKEVQQEEKKELMQEAKKEEMEGGGQEEVEKETQHVVLTQEEEQKSKSGDRSIPPEITPAEASTDTLVKEEAKEEIMTETKGQDTGDIGNEVMSASEIKAKQKEDRRQTIQKRQETQQASSEAKATRASEDRYKKRIEDQRIKNEKKEDAKIQREKMASALAMTVAEESHEEPPHEEEESREETRKPRRVRGVPPKKSAVSVQPRVKLPYKDKDDWTEVLNPSSDDHDA